MRPPTRFERRLAAIAVVGLVARVVATVVANRHAELGLGDGFFYHEAAKLLADGEGYVDPIRASIGDFRATALHPPLWSALLAVPSAIGFDSELAHRLVGCLVGTGTVVVVGQLGRVVAGARVGLLAAAILALHPTLLAADGSLHAETVFGLFAAAALLAAVVAARDHDVRVAALAGAACALAALARGEGLVLALFLAIALATVAPHGRRWKISLALVGTTIVVLAPWTARNVVLMDGSVPLSTNEATVLAGANCDPTFAGPDIGTWYVECVEAVPFEVSEVERSERWRADAIEYGLDHLERTPLVATARFGRVWGLWRPFSQEIVEGRSLGLQMAGIVAHLVVIVPLAVVGAVLARRRLSVPLRFLLVPLLTVSVTAVLAFGTLRFRHGAEPALAVLAALGVDALVRRWSRGREAERYDPAGAVG